MTRLGDPDYYLHEVGQTGDKNYFPGKSTISPQRKYDWLSNQVHEADLSPWVYYYTSFNVQTHPGFPDLGPELQLRYSPWVSNLFLNHIDFLGQTLP